MPLYSYRCVLCGTPQELLCAVESKPGLVECCCGGDASPRVTRLARTPGRWGGVDTAHYNRGLGYHVDSYRDVDRIAEKRGLVPLSDMDAHFVDDAHDAYVAEAKQGEADTQEYQGLIASGVTAGEAAARTFSVSKMQDRGILDTAVKGE